MNTERRKRQVAPPLKKSKPSWRISGEDRQPPERWRIDRDQNGRICLIEECVPPEIRSGSPISPSTRSRFEIEITEACMVGGHAVEPGCRVIAFAPNAACIAPRGKILSEERNSF